MDAERPMDTLTSMTIFDLRRAYHDSLSNMRGWLGDNDLSGNLTVLDRLSILDAWQQEMVEFFEKHGHCFACNRRLKVPLPRSRLTSAVRSEPPGTRASAPRRAALDASSPQPGQQRTDRVDLPRVPRGLGRRVWNSGDYRRSVGRGQPTCLGSRPRGFHVWLDDENRVLSSMKLYRPLIRIGETVARAAVLGAIFTPMTRRRRGYAGAMLGAVIRRCREEGHRACLLFSDIGTAYYARFGFVPLPAEEQWGRIPNPRRGAADGWELREMRDEDLDDVRRMHDEAGLSPTAGRRSGRGALGFPSLSDA